MAKYCGSVGFFDTVETEPGVWEQQITERTYYGDVIHEARTLSQTSKVNDDISISNRISILSDPYLNEHFWNMAYITFMGAKWKASSVEVQFPRLVISLGGLYNE